MTPEAINQYKRDIIAIEKFCFKLEKLIKSVNINDPGVNVLYIRKAMDKYSKAAIEHRLIMHHLWDSNVFI
jgi:hypothetical protein